MDAIEYLNNRKMGLECAILDAAKQGSSILDRLGGGYAEVCLMLETLTKPIEPELTVETSEPA